MTIKNLEDSEKMAEVVELFKNNEEKRRNMLTDEIMNCEIEETVMDEL